MATRPNPFAGKETPGKEKAELKLSAKKYAAGERSEGEKGKALKKPMPKGRKC